MFKTAFSIHRHPSITPAHPVSVPIRLPTESSAVTSFETDIYSVYQVLYIYIANATRYQVHTRYTRACGVWVVTMAAGLLAFSSRQFALTINQSWTFVRFTLYIVSVAGRPRSEAPGIYTRNTSTFILSYFRTRFPRSGYWLTRNPRGCRKLKQCTQAFLYI